MQYFDHAQLRNSYKLYLFQYYSNELTIPDLAATLGDTLEIEGVTDFAFDSSPLAIVAHSMGGLVARSYMQQYVHSKGAFRGRRGGDRTLKLITLGTPHHGSPLANGRARDAAAGPGWGTGLVTFDEQFFTRFGPSFVQRNRSELRWTNYDRLLDYDVGFPEEANSWLAEDLNSDSVFYEKIIAYGGAITPSLGNCTDLTDGEALSFCWGSIILGGVLGLANDGIVPLSSALFFDPSGTPRVPTRYFSDYNHTEIRTGRSDGVLFEKLKSDLEDIHESASARVLLAEGLTINPPELPELGTELTATFSVANSGSGQITIDVLTVGGRLNGDDTCSNIRLAPNPNSRCADFTWFRNIPLAPGGSFTYRGTLRPPQSGRYNFFVAYRTSDGRWHFPVPGAREELTNTAEVLVYELLDKSLIKSPQSATVYWYQNRIRYGIIGETVIRAMQKLRSWNLTAITHIPLTKLEGISQGSDFIEAGVRSDGLLIKNPDRPAVYVIENGEKHIITTEAFIERGYDWDDIIEVTPTVLDSIPTGVAITTLPSGKVVGRVVYDKNGNGHQDLGEPFVTHPAIPCMTGFNLPGLFIRWIGPTESGVAIEGCNPEPFYDTGPIPIGTYSFSLKLPRGWQITKGENHTVNVSQNRVSDAWFYITDLLGDADRLSLKLSMTDFCVGDEWILDVRNAAPSSPVLLTAWQDGRLVLKDFVLDRTDLSGKLSESGIFPPGIEGSWQELVVVQGKESNLFSFSVRDCGTNSKPILALDEPGYCVGEEWNLTVRGSPNSRIDLHGISSGQPWSIENWSKTNVDGKYSTPGKFGTDTVGEYFLWVVVSERESNRVKFTVSQCSSPPPEIYSTRPSPIKPDEQIWLTAEGNGFQPGFTAEVLVGSNTYSIETVGTEFVSPQELRVSVKMADQGVRYSAILKIKNPDGQSASRGFIVDGKPQVVVDPKLSSSPLSGVPGTTFATQGTGFTANNAAVLRVRLPNGSEANPRVKATDGRGQFTDTYTVQPSDPLGTYTLWAIDSTTGKKSNEVTQEVQRSASYEGYHDSISCEITMGWAWDRNRPNDPIPVDIYDGPTKLATILADQFRQDLKDAGKGSGAHGFQYVLPSSLRDGRNHSVEVRFGGTSTRLANSPKALDTTACSVADFRLTVSPSTRNIRQGESTLHSVTIQGLNSFNGTITLSVSGFPLNTAPGTGIFPSTVTLSPNTSGSATLSVFTTNSTQTGSFSVTVTATGAEKTRSATLSLTIEAATDPQKLPSGPAADPSLGNWTSSPQAITVTCGNAARIWYTVSTTTDGNTPADPPEPNSSLNNGQIAGAAGVFPVSASSGEYKKLKVRFRGENSSGYGPSSGPYFYSIDLRSSKAPVAAFSITGDGKTATSPNELTVTVGPAGVLTMAFSASASYDPDGQITRYAWKNGSELISVDREFTKPFGVGTYAISLTVADNDGLTATTASVLRVVDRPVGQVHVRAALNGVNWEGPLSLNITGPASTVTRSTVPTSLPDAQSGTYTVSYQGGGPENSTLDSYSPAQSQVLGTGQSITFTLNFKSIPLGAFTLTATPQCTGTTSEMLLQWTASQGATAYTLYITGPTGSRTRGMGSQRSFVDSALTSGATYTYFVRANDNYNNTKDSNSVTIAAPYCSLLNFDLIPPPAPRYTGKPLLYTSTIHGGKPPFTYSWSGEASGSGTWNATTFPASGPQISLTYSTPGKKTVTLTMTDATSRVEPRSVEIDVVNPPPPTVTLHVLGTLNGQPWDGPANYKIVGRDTVHTFNGTKIDPAPNGSVFTGGPADQYSFTYLGGGPADGVSINPSATTLRAGEVGWFYIDFQKLLPDLEHYNFSDAGGGWDGPLIVSTEPGNHKLVREVPVNKDLYVDFALRNYPSNTATVPTSFTVDLLVDGTVVNAWTVDPLAPGKTFTANDYVIRFTTIGNHRVEFRIDPENRIQEKREDNNRWYVDLTVTEISSFVFQDDFNRTDLGPGWSVDTCVNGSVQIVSGRLKIFSKPAGGLVCDSKTVRAMVSGPVLTDVTTEFDFDGGPLTRSNNMTIVYARYVSPSSHYGVSIQRDELTDNPSRQSIVMYAPGRILAQALSTNLQPGRYQFSVVGNQLNFKNVGGTGTPINLTATDSAFTNGGVGFATNEAPEVYIDNVTVQGTKVQ